MMVKKKKKVSWIREAAKGAKSVLGGFADAGNKSQSQGPKKNSSKCGSC